MIIPEHKSHMPPERQEGLPGAGVIIPGVPDWRLGTEARHPGLHYHIFPSKVDGDQALAKNSKS